MGKGVFRKPKTPSRGKAGAVDAFNNVKKGVPPVQYQFKPGQSGNPTGLPSESRQVMVRAIKDMLARVDPKLNKSLFERLLEVCGRRALQGSKWHMGVLFDYALGKPLQSQVNVNTEIGLEDRISGLTDEQLVARLKEITLQNFKTETDSVQ